jgi:DNA polymerase II small subunit/DNA polymerase delta subunit B
MDDIALNDRFERLEALVKAEAAETRAYIDLQAGETRRHFDVVAKGLTQEIRVIAEGHLAARLPLDTRPDAHSSILI